MVQLKQLMKWGLALSLLAPLAQCSRDDAKEVINGINGINGVDGTKIHSGKGSPSVNLGVNGDFYIDLDSQRFFGPKTENGWGDPFILKGADGKDGVDGVKGADGKNGADGKDGANGRDGTTLWHGTTAPDMSIGNVGDWYIDLQSKILYGPKTNNGWGIGIELGERTIKKWDYLLSKDGRVLLEWLNGEVERIDMEADPDLRNVKVIARRAFYGLEIKAVVLPNGLEEIRRQAFAGNQLTSVEIPNSVKSIEGDAFLGNQLVFVTLGNGIASIGERAFQNNRLTFVTLGNSVTSIGAMAFERNQLTSVVIPNSVTSIEYGAFFNNRLTLVTIGNSVESIGGYAFSNNPLTEVRVLANTPPGLGYSAFNENLQRIIVPMGSVEAYKKAVGWRDYADKIVGE